MRLKLPALKQKGRHTKGIQTQQTKEELLLELNLTVKAKLMVGRVLSGKLVCKMIQVSTTVYATNPRIPFHYARMLWMWLCISPKLII